MTGHQLIQRESYDECVRCAQTFTHECRRLADLVPCQMGTTDPHVWTVTADGVECAYCRTSMTLETPPLAVPADCTTDPLPQPDLKSTKEQVSRMPTHYTAGWNQPRRGDTALPGSFENFTDAVKHLATAVDRLWDVDERDRGSAEAQRRWIPVDTALHNAGNGPTFHELTGDRRIEFWIEAVGGQ